MQTAEELVLSIHSPFLISCFHKHHILCVRLLGDVILSDQSLSDCHMDLEWKVVFELRHRGAVLSVLLELIGREEAFTVLALNAH
jgi:hypothetical protein